MADRQEARKAAQGRLSAAFGRRAAENRRARAARLVTEAEAARANARLTENDPRRLRAGEDREEAALRLRRLEQLRQGRAARRALAEGGFEPDLQRPEQILQAWHILQRKGAEPARVMRRGVAHDPALKEKIGGDLFAAACRLERWAAEAARLGSSASPLAAWIDGGGARGHGEGDPDAARARIVTALRRLAETRAALSDAAELQTPHGPRSRRDAVDLCVLQALPIAALAGAKGGRRWSAARDLLIAALGDLADLLGERRESGRIESWSAG